MQRLARSKRKRDALEAAKKFGGTDSLQLKSSAISGEDRSLERWTKEGVFFSPEAPMKRPGLMGLDPVCKIEGSFLLQSGSAHVNVEAKDVVPFLSRRSETCPFSHGKFDPAEAWKEKNVGCISGEKGKTRRKIMDKPDSAPYIAGIGSGQRCRQILGIFVEKSWECQIS